MLVEELGHWIDDQAHGLNGGDSAGDEGRRLAQALLPEITNSSSTSNDHVLMQLNDAWFKPSSPTPGFINKPVRLDQGPRALVIIEDGTTTNLGLQACNGLSKQSSIAPPGSRQAIDPAQINQRLNHPGQRPARCPAWVKCSKPMAQPLNLNDPLSIDELKNLKFQGIANAHGESTFSYDVTNGNGDASSEKSLHRGSGCQRQPNPRERAVC